MKSLKKAKTQNQTRVLKFSVLEFIDGRWQATATQYAVDKTTTVGRAISGNARFRHTTAEDLRPAPKKEP